MVANSDTDNVADWAQDTITISRQEGLYQGWDLDVIFQSSGTQTAKLLCRRADTISEIVVIFEPSERAFTRRITSRIVTGALSYHLDAHPG